MSEEQKKQVERICEKMNTLTPEMQEKALIFMQGMAAGQAARSAENG